MAKIIRIQAVPGVTGGRFCRGGRCFGIQPTELAEDELTAEQLAAIQAEPMLVVEITEEAQPTPAQAKVEAKAKEETKADAAPQEGEDARPEAPEDAKSKKKEGGK